MKTELVFTHIPITDENLSDRTVVVVDILRTSTTICIALKNGAKEIIPVESVPAAMQLIGNLSRDNTLLCGEREGVVIEGFNLGNSPLEYSEEVIKGKTLVICTTNGSVALTKTKSARVCIVCGFVNVSACVNFILEQKRDLLIVCAGSNKQFDLEDAVCGGMIVNMLQEKIGGEMEINDGTEAAVIIYQKYKDNYLHLLQNCHHGKYLASLGFGEDLKICSQVDSLEVVPLYAKSRVALKRDEVNNGTSNGLPVE